MASIPSDKTLMFLGAVADWAAARHVEIRIWRTDAPAPSNYTTPIADWRVTVTLRDSEGLCQGTVIAFHPGRRETPDAFGKRVAAVLDRCCAETRRRRITAYAGIDPRRMVGTAEARA